MEFKGTKGHHQLMFNSNVCIGIGVKNADNPNYYQMICNTILPDTDEQYEIEKDEIIANMKVYAAAPELLSVLQYIVENDDGVGICLGYQSRELAKAAINKALHP